MPDVTDQLREWSNALAESVEPADFDKITSPRAVAETSHGSRRWFAVAASVLVLVAGAGVVVVTTLGGDDAEQIRTVTDPEQPAVSTTLATTPTTTPPSSPSSTSRPPTAPAAQWQPVPIEFPARLDADSIPRLAISDPGLTDPVRVEFSESPPAAEFVQVFGTADGSGWLHIETSVRAQGPAAWEIQGDSIGPWTTHTSQFEATDSYILTLRNGQLTVSLWSNTVDADQLRIVASSLRQGATSSAGWSVAALPDGFEPIAGGPSSRAAIYSMNYGDPSAQPFGLAAALEISVDSPTMLSTAFLNESGVDFDIVSVGGQRALFLVFDSVPPTLIWEPQSRIVARLGIPNADADALIAVAESLQEVDDVTWDQMSTTTPNDGCPHFWC